MSCFQALRTPGLAAISLGLFYLGNQSAFGFGGPTEQTENRAKNLARANCGARIHRIGPSGGVAPVSITSETNQNPTALILDDNTLGCVLPPGDTTFVIELPKITLLDRLAFVNQDAAAEGEVELAVSNYRLDPVDSKWISVAARAPFSGKRLVNLKIVGVEAKYLRLSFYARRAGRLAGLALYGVPTLEDFARRQAEQARTLSFLASARLEAGQSKNTLNFNVANQYARARVAYVSSGVRSLSGRMIDDDAATAFRFSESDRHPTIILELAETCPVRRVSAVYQSGADQFDVYLLNELPNDPANLRDTKPVGSIKPVGGGAAVDFDIKNAHYVALRWTREKTRMGSFEVSEVGAFGIASVCVLDLEQVPTTLATTGLQLPGESGLDFSNSLGTLADPPVMSR
jgi:hypothetical protein